MDSPGVKTQKKNIKLVGMTRVPVSHSRQSSVATE